MSTFLASLRLIKVITNQHVVNGLVKDNDSKIFIKHTLNYILNDEAKIPLKVNLLIVCFVIVKFRCYITGYKVLYPNNSPMTFCESSKFI